MRGPHVSKFKCRDNVNREKLDVRTERKAGGLAAERLGLQQKRYGYQQISCKPRSDDIVTREKRGLSAIRRLGQQAKYDQAERMREGDQDGQPARKPPCFVKRI